MSHVKFGLPRFAGQHLHDSPQIVKEEGSTYSELRATFNGFMTEKGRLFESVSRLIGGVYSNRVVNGQNGELTPYEAVAYEDQKEAMSLITTKLLSNEAFVFNSEIIKLLQPEKRAAYNPNEDHTGKAVGFKRS